jgi:hypothetical protein
LVGMNLHRLVLSDSSGRRPILTRTSWPCTWILLRLPVTLGDVGNNMLVGHHGCGRKSAVTLYSLSLRFCSSHSSWDDRFQPSRKCAVPATWSRPKRNRSGVDCREDTIMNAARSRVFRLILASVSNSKIVCCDLCVVLSGLGMTKQVCGLRARMSFAVLGKPMRALVVCTNACQAGAQRFVTADSLRWRYLDGSHGHSVDFHGDIGTFSSFL